MDFSTIPLLALSNESKELISTLLNPRKILSTDDKWPRDWRGLAYMLDIPGEKITLLESQTDPSNKILGSLQEKRNTKITYKDLQNALEKMDRWDVISDTEPLFVKDAQQYFEKVEKSQLTLEAVNNNVDAEMLTIDDLYSFRFGLGKQVYDAFILYADEDFEFAKEMIERLERENLKLCTKDRDLIAGVTFEHDAIMQLISDRCNRLIVIISPMFLKSPSNTFFLKYGQAVGIEKQQRKLIPLIYKECELPRQLSYTNKVFYNRRGLYDFWGKLCDSIRTPSPPKSKLDNNSTMEKAALRGNLESCSTNNTKETIVSPEEKASKENGFLKIDEELKDVDRDPQLGKCARISSKKHLGLFTFRSDKIKNKAKKPDESSDKISEEKISDSVTGLPSLVSLDDVGILPSYSVSEKKSTSTFMKKVKKMTTKLKA